MDSLTCHKSAIGKVLFEVRGKAFARHKFDPEGRQFYYKEGGGYFWYRKYDPNGKVMLFVCGQDSNGHITITRFYRTQKATINDVWPALIEPIHDFLFLEYCNERL